MKSLTIAVTLILFFLVGCSNIDKVKKAIRKVESDYKVNFEESPLEEYGKSVPNSYVYQLNQPFSNGIEIKDKLKNEISKAVDYLPTESKESEALRNMDGTLDHFYDHYEWIGVDHEITLEASYQGTQSVRVTIWTKSK